MASKYKKRLPSIKYTSRDFQSIRNDLIEHARKYYPDTFRDFSEASFGSMMVDSVAYIGDILSFYLDYQVNESFLDTSIEYNNILRHGYALGYKHRGPAAALGEIALYISCPANSSGMGINTDYLPVIKRGSVVVSRSGGSYTLVDDVRFNDTTNQVVVSKVNESTGLPTHYAIKAYGRIMSGVVKTVSFEGDFERFRRLRIGTSDVSEIVSVVDAEGNQYYEVDYLSQDTIHKEIVNKNVANDPVSSILKPFTVPRRFTVVRTRSSTSLQFGQGSASETSSPSVVDPKNISLDVFGKDYVSDRSFDPSRLISTDKFGIGPSNTKLRIKYIRNNDANSNSAVGSVNKVTQLETFFEKESTLSTQIMGSVRGSVECFNESPISGRTRPATVDEVRQDIADVFATQNRAVTTLKRNLKTWLGKYKMMTDTIDILDAKVVNIGIEYKVVITPGVDKFKALQDASASLSRLFQRKYFIGEMFSIPEVWSALNRSGGILDVKDVKIVTKTGTGYSKTGFNIEQNLSPDGRFIATPINVALEIKFPGTDIKGTAV